MIKSNANFEYQIFNTFSFANWKEMNIRFFLFDLLFFLLQVQLNSLLLIYI